MEKIRMKYPSKYEQDTVKKMHVALHWRHDGHDGVSNHQHRDCLFNRFEIQAQIIENIKAPRYWPLCREFTGPGWIPRTKGQ